LRELQRSTGHVLNAVDLKKGLLFRFIHATNLGAQIVSDFLRDADSDRITGGKDSVIVGPKLSGLFDDPDYRGATVFMNPLRYSQLTSWNTSHDACNRRT